MDAPWPPQTKPGPQPINLWMAPMKFMDAPGPPKIYGWPPTEIHCYTPWTPMDPPQTHFRVVPMKFMDGPQLLTTYGCPQKWKTEFSAITWNSHLHPMTHFNPPQTHLWVAPMKFMDGPQLMDGPDKQKTAFWAITSGMYQHTMLSHITTQNLWMAPM